MRIRAALWTAIAAFGAGFSALAVLRHEAFNSGRFDLGNMVQVVWSTAHGDPLRMTDTGGEQISRLAAHTDVLLAAFAPLWLVWPSPSLLLVVQAVVRGAGRAPRVLARSQAPRVAAGRARLRACLSALSARAVARAGRLPRRRPRVPVPALRLLVPGRGPALALRGLRRPRRPDQGRGRIRGGGPWALVRARPRPAARRAADRGRRRRGLAPGDPRRHPGLRRGRIGLLPALRRGRRVARRHCRDSADRSDPRPRGRLRRHGARLPGSDRGAPRPRAPRSADAARRPARARDQPALVDADPDVDPLPLHRRDHAGIRGRKHLRRRPDHSTAAAGGGAARGDHRRRSPSSRAGGSARSRCGRTYPAARTSRPTSGASTRTTGSPSGRWSSCRTTPS